MSLAERIGLGPREYLFPRPERPRDDQDLHELPFKLPYAVGIWLREFERGRSMSGIWSGLRKAESPIRHVLEAFEFVARMDIADRASNGLRQAVLWDNRVHTKPSDFGLLLTRAFDNPALSDHNHEHSRRQERWLEAMMLNIEELRHSHTIKEWVDSCELFSYWHDADQLLTLQRNLEEGTNFKAKKGHALGAAVMLLALHERYAYERKVSVETAWRICSGAAIMIMKHDKPERFSQALQGTQKAYHYDTRGHRKLYKGEALTTLFDENKLDLFSLAPVQMVELLRMEKQAAGFISLVQPDSFGLHPYFEEEYAQSLASLKLNVRPLLDDLQDLRDERRQSFRLAAEAAVQSDVLEMVAPPVESIIRTLNTAISRDRPFWRAGDINQLFDLIVNGAGDQPPETDSSARRIWWELLHVEHHTQEKSVVSRSTYIRHVNRDNAIMGAIAFKFIGERLMTGDVSAFDRVYTVRKAALALKVLDRADVGTFERLWAMYILKKTGDPSVIQKVLLSREHGSLAEQFLQKLQHLDIEAQSVREAFLRKSEGDGDTAPHYSEEEINQFHELAKRVIGSLCEKYGVSKHKLKRYTIRVLQGKYPGILPYGSYDSIGGKPKTLVSPLGIHT